MTTNTSSATHGSLHGLRVIDLSRVLGGPYCVHILADHGADVLKIEPPQGDETRTWGPPFENGVASYYMGLNRNKRGMRMDLNQPAEREKLLEMLADADVRVTDQAQSHASNLPLATTVRRLTTWFALAWSDQCRMRI